MPSSRRTQPYRAQAGRKQTQALVAMRRGVSPTQQRPRPVRKAANARARRKVRPRDALGRVLKRRKAVALPRSVRR